MKPLFLLLPMLWFILSCSSDNNDLNESEIIDSSVKPQLKSMKFLATDNPLQLVDDANCTIVNDSIIECWIPNIVKDKTLIPTLSFTGDFVSFDDVVYSGGGGNFSKPVKLTVSLSDHKKDYIVYVYSYTGLPLLWIDTNNRIDTVFSISRNEYTKAHLRLEENVVTRSAGDVVESEVKIKGRGNSSWDDSPKKSYRLQFDNKISLLDEPKDKSYVLIANYFDKTMLRNKIAYYIGAISKLDYTPKFHFVELFLIWKI